MLNISLYQEITFDIIPSSYQVILHTCRSCALLCVFWSCWSESAQQTQSWDLPVSWHLAEVGLTSPLHPARKWCQASTRKDTLECIEWASWYEQDNGLNPQAFIYWRFSLNMWMELSWWRGFNVKHEPETECSFNTLRKKQCTIERSIDINWLHRHPIRLVRIARISLEWIYFRKEYETRIWKKNMNRSKRMIFSADDLLQRMSCVDRCWIVVDIGVAPWGVADGSWWRSAGAAASLHLSASIRTL